MQVIQTSDTSDSSPVVAAVSERLNRELQAGKRVTWLVCGGSNIPLIAKAMGQIAPDLTSRLTILLTDERYGKPGHDDSNWKQLYDAGFDGHNATIIETLQAEQTLEETCERYGEQVRQALDETDITIAHFGIGGDGHIAGILPESAASRMDNDEDPFVTGYDAGSFTRVTITPKVWQDIDLAYACAFGTTKQQALQRLQHEDLRVESQPAQLLKRLAEAYLYTDQAYTDQAS